MTIEDGGGRRARIARDFPLLTRVGLVCAWFLAALVIFRQIQVAVTDSNLASDSHAYWLTGQSAATAYDLAPGQADAYLYSPAFAQAISPLTKLPWPAFMTLWMALELGVLLWLVRPLSMRWAIPLALVCVPELVNGNVYLLFAGVAVAGLRYPGLWALPALTKVLPAVGLLWFAMRCEWRQLLQGLLAIVAIVTASFVLAPDTWLEWFGFLVENRTGTRENSALFVVRGLLGLCLLAFGARSGRAWTLAPVMVLVSPALALTTLTILLALPRLLECPSSLPASMSCRKGEARASGTGTGGSALHTGWQQSERMGASRDGAVKQISGQLPV